MAWWLKVYVAPLALLAQIRVSWALVKRTPRKLGIGLVLIQAMSLRIQKPRSCRMAPDAVDVVVGADHPQRAAVFEHAPAACQPFAAEGIVLGEAGELVPVVVDRVDAGVVGPEELLLELQVVGRVGEDQVDRFFRQARQHLAAVAGQDLVEGQGRVRLAAGLDHNT